MPHQKIKELMQQTFKKMLWELRIVLASLIESHDVT